MTAINNAGSRLATRLAFLVAGFGLASWAPLVPYVRQRFALDEGVLGMLLLCLGVGSVAAMAATGPLSARFGSRVVIGISGLLLALLLPMLALANSVAVLAGALCVFGAALGALDVAMNLHAVEVERAAQTPLMSGFHALFSVGGFAGASLMTLLLTFQVNAVLSTILAAALMVAAIVVAWPRLIRTVEPSTGPLFAMPRGVVLVIALMAGIMFLAEGAILDWGALLITDAGLVALSQGGIAYILFSIAMTGGRFAGDAISARLGDRAILRWGGALAVIGIAVVLCATHAAIAMLGFILIGLGASNVVPVLFRLVGSQTVMSPSLAVAAISTVGYSGVLIGPAGVGLVARISSLPWAFALLAALICFVPLCARIVAPQSGVPR